MLAKLKLLNSHSRDLTRSHIGGLKSFQLLNDSIEWSSSLFKKNKALGVCKVAVWNLWLFQLVQSIVVLIMSLERCNLPLIEFHRNKIIRMLHVGPTSNEIKMLCECLKCNCTILTVSFCISFSLSLTIEHKCK